MRWETLLQRRCVHRAALALLALAASQACCFAATIALQSIDEMTARTDLIVTAVPKTGSPVTTWDQNHNLIVTRTTLIVLEPLFGAVQPGSEIVVETLGGFIPAEDIGMQVDGSPVFRDEEEVLLFLWRSPVSGVFRTLDLAAGKFEIGNKEGRLVVTRRDLSAKEVVGGNEPSKNPGTLEELRAAIDAALEARSENLKSRHRPTVPRPSAQRQVRGGRP